jgi:hypothetical protein
VAQPGSCRGTELVARRNLKGKLHFHPPDKTSILGIPLIILIFLINLKQKQKMAETKEVSDEELTRRFELEDMVEKQHSRCETTVRDVLIQGAATNYWKSCDF